MPPLFFALAAASSDARESGTGINVGGGRLSLLQGTPGWQSARCPTYPQEILLELESAAEINLIEVGARGTMTPSSIDVLISGDGEPASLEGVAFNPVGSIRFNDTEAVQRASEERKRALKLYGLCSGQVKLLVHEPIVSDKDGNQFKQVALESIAIVGRSDPHRAVAPSLVRPAKRAQRPDHLEMQDVLLELGIPLDIVPPVNDETLRFPEVDDATKVCLNELREKHQHLVQSAKYGEAERIHEHMDQLRKAGPVLKELLERRRDLVEAESLQEAEHLSAQIQELEQKRLDIAAFWTISFWERKMAFHALP